MATDQMYYIEGHYDNTYNDFTYNDVLITLNTGDTTYNDITYS